MAIKNIPATIKVPGVDGASSKIEFVASAAADDQLRIPRRYPFADISNYSSLKDDGFFRHATTDVSDELGGSKASDTEGVLGYQLPRTEKLVLLAKKGAAEAESITIKGSKQYNIDDLVVEIPSGSSGDLYEIDLYNMGLLLEGVAGEPGVIIESADTTLSLALVVRHG